MGIQNYTVKYSTDNVNYTELSNVQNIDINIGRQAQLEPYNASRATVVVRYPTGYASPITALTSGNFIKIENASTGQFLFFGVIENVDVQYGIPYEGGVGNADYLTFSVEGRFSRFGRVQGLNYAMAADTLYNQGLVCTAETGLQLNIAHNNTQAMAATTITGTWGEWLQKLLVTINGRVWDAQPANYVTINTPFFLLSSQVSFSDTTNDATNQVYDQINFGSYADNFYTQVTVNPESFGEATVQTGVAPFRTLQTNTLNASTSQATDYATYLLSNYQNKGFALLSISCAAESQNVFKLDAVAGGTTRDLPALPGTKVSVTFRGTVFNCIIEGCVMSGTPESSRYTYFLSGQDLNAYLILDDAIYGKLDTNKLGY